MAKAPTRISVRSSVIRAVLYDEENAVLEITFHHGRTYRYAGVPKFLYDGLLVSPSKGSYFNRRIAGRYAFTEVG